MIRSVNNKQAKIVIVAPDLEPSPGPNGLDKLIVNLSNACKDNQVPLMYALSRKELGAVIKNPPVKISVVSITDISSVEREAQNLIEMSERNRKRYIDYFVMQLDYSINPSYFI